MRFLRCLQSRCVNIVPVVLHPFVPEIRLNRSLSNGQIVDSDGEVVSVDLSGSTWSFSDFSILNLSAVGFSPDGVETILPSRFSVVDSLSKIIE